MNLKQLISINRLIKHYLEERKYREVDVLLSSNQLATHQRSHKETIHGKGHYLHTIIPICSLNITGHDYKYSLISFYTMMVLPYIWITAEKLVVLIITLVD